MKFARRKKFAKVRSNRGFRRGRFAGISEALEPRQMLSGNGFSDDFEAPVLNSFWSKREDSGSVVFPGVNRSHSGGQSVQMLSTANTGQKEINLHHNFASPVHGTFSIWFYDTGADVTSSNYLQFWLDGPNSTGASLVGDDYDFGDSYKAQGAYTGIDRTQAWYNFSIEATPTEVRYRIDGSLVRVDNNGLDVTGVTFSMRGPTWRPAWETNFDDFSYTPLVPDIQVDSVTADGATTLTANYTIAGADAPAFDLAFFRSTDASFDGADTNLSTVSIANPADLSVGQHSKTWTIGGTPGQIPLPGAGAAEDDTDYYLLAVADPTNAVAEDDVDVTNEDNTKAFYGAYRPTGGSLYLHGDDSASTVDIGVVNTNTVVVSLDGTNYPIPNGTGSALPSIRARTHGGADVVSTPYGDKTTLILGGPGADTLVGPDADRVWNVQSSNAGKTGRTVFASVENLVGGAADDRFRLADGQGVSGFIDGGGGINTLDYSPYKSSVAIDLATGAATQVANGVTRVANAYGGAAADRIVGDSGANFLKGNGGADALTGGEGDDSLDGGAGTDRVVEQGDVNFTLGASTLAGLGTDTLMSIEQAFLTGGAGANTIDASGFAGVVVLRGLGGADSLTGCLGRDILIGGDGGDALNGGGGEDILLAGATQFDADESALLAILAEWTSARSFQARLANIRGSGAGPRFNGARFFTAGSTAFSDNQADSLKGSGDLDWYFAALGDSLLDASTGEIVDVL